MLQHLARPVSDINQPHDEWLDAELETRRKTLVAQLHDLDEQRARQAERALTPAQGPKAEIQTRPIKQEPASAGKGGKATASPEATAGGGPSGASAMPIWTHMMELLASKVASSEERADHVAQTQAVLAAAVAALHKPESNTLKDLGSAEIDSLRGGMEPHNVEAWLTRALARLTHRCEELAGIINMPEDAWALCCNQRRLAAANS